MVSPQIKRKMRKIHFKVNKKAPVMKSSFPVNDGIPGIKSSFPMNDGTNGSGNQTAMQRGESQLGGQLELNNINNHNILCAKSMMMMDTLGKANASDDDGDDEIKFETARSFSDENSTDGNTILLCAKTMMIDALGRVDILNNNDDAGVDIKATGKNNKDDTSENMKHRTTSDETLRDDKTILCAKTMMIEALARVNISDNDKTSFYKTNDDRMVLLDLRISPDGISRGDKTRRDSGVKNDRGTFERKSSVGKTIIIRTTTNLTNSSSLKENKKKMPSTSSNNLKYTYETVGNSIQGTGSDTTLASLNDKEDITSRITPRFSRDNTSTPDDCKVTRAANTKDTFGRKISDLGKNMNNNNNNNNKNNNHRYNTSMTGERDTIAKGRLWKKISSEWDYNNNNEYEINQGNPKKSSLFSVTSEDGEREEDIDDDCDEEEVEVEIKGEVLDRRPLPLWMQEAQCNLT